MYYSALQEWQAFYYYYILLIYLPLWGPNRFWPGSGLVLRCLGPGFTVLALGPGFRPIFIHSLIY